MAQISTLLSVVAVAVLAYCGEALAAPVEKAEEDREPKMSSGRVSFSAARSCASRSSSKAANDADSEAGRLSSLDEGHCAWKI